MTETVIVNRTPESWGERRDREAIETAENEGAPTQDQLPVYDVVTKQTYTREEFNQTAEKNREAQVGKILLEPLTESEKPNPVVETVIQHNPDGSAEVEHKTFDDILDELVEQAANDLLASKEDFEKFRKQVIAAFKHLGLDTVKHFGV